MSETANDLVTRAYAVRRQGDGAGSLALYRQAEQAFGADAAGRAHCLRHIGDLEREAGRQDAALAALREAEALYRGPAADRLSLANTLRLLAILEDDRGLWQEARALYERVGTETGLDMAPALAECDRRLGVA